GRVRRDHPAGDGEVPGQPLPRRPGDAPRPGSGPRRGQRARHRERSDRPGPGPRSGAPGVAGRRGRNPRRGPGGRPRRPSVDGGGAEGSEGEVTPGTEKPPAQPVNPDRRAAEVLRPHGFEVTVKLADGQERTLKPADPLPAERFAVVGVLIEPGPFFAEDFVR